MQSNEEKLKRIREHLQQKEVFERIQKKMEEARSGATVSTKRAATLFDMGEQQLRDWERRGLIRAERTPASSSSAGKQTTGHRQFTLDELDRLALVKELLSENICTLNDIPPNLLDIWQGMKTAAFRPAAVDQTQIGAIDVASPFEVRIDRARAKLFWRFYASHALRFASLLIAENMPGETVTLVLPLCTKNVIVKHIDDIPALGESLVGWLTRSRSSQTSLVSSLTFTYAIDYRAQALRVMKADIPLEQTPLDSTVIVLRRAARPLTLSAEVVDTIRLLLKPLYEHAEDIRACFGSDMYDVLDPAPDLNNSNLYPDLILNGLADMIVALGRTVDQQHRWRFCCILLPNNAALPLQQQSLAVQAQSQHSPHKIGLSISPEKGLNSLSLRAYQSGRISYRDTITPDDSTIAYKDEEHPVHSAIALPIGGEDGEPAGVIYVTSEFERAFSEIRDRRVLRLLGRMASELIRTYQASRKEAQGLSDLLRLPDVVDELQGDVPSENTFIHDLEGFLRAFKEQFDISEGSLRENFAQVDQERRQPEDVLSLIGIDVDHLGGFALKYGNQAVRNLCYEIGQRIRGELASTFKKYPGCQYYHIYGDRFYVLLKHVPYDQVLSKARLLKKSLDGSYNIRLLRSTGLQPPPSGTLEELAITVRLAVSSYNDTTLEELFDRYPGDVGIYSIREMMERSLSTELKKGMAEGGDVIRAWNDEVRAFEALAEEKM